MVSTENMPHPGSQNADFGLARSDIRRRGHKVCGLQGAGGNDGTERSF